MPNQWGDKFLETVNKIKSVFAPVVDWFDDKVGKIKGFFNGIGNAARNAKRNSTSNIQYKYKKQ